MSHRPHIALLLVLLLVSVFPSGCERVKKMLYSPKIRVSCQILQKRCKFTNFGDPGEACVRVKVFHFESGRTLASEPVCSGHLERDEPRWVPVSFSEADPNALCMGPDLRQDFKKHCEVEIAEHETPEAQP